MTVVDVGTAIAKEIDKREEEKQVPQNLLIYGGVFY